jgi:predicted AAA+ superfamily ATPase
MFTRLASSGIGEALTFMRIVAITGPWQSGKSTLAKLLAGQGAVYRSLDEPDLLSSAAATGLFNTKLGFR